MIHRVLRRNLLGVALLAALSTTAVAESSHSLPGFEFGYRMGGAGDLRPVQVFDDGHQTYFQFRDLNNMPAIILDGAQAMPMPYEIHSHYVVVRGVHDHYLLRMGHQTATVDRTKPAPAASQFSWMDTPAAPPRQDYPPAAANPPAPAAMQPYAPPPAAYPYPGQPGGYTPPAYPAGNGAAPGAYGAAPAYAPPAYSQGTGRNPPPAYEPPHFRAPAPPAPPPTWNPPPVSSAEMPPMPAPPMLQAEPIAPTSLPPLAVPAAPVSAAGTSEDARLKVIQKALNLLAAGKIKPELASQVIRSASNAELADEETSAAPRHPAAQAKHKKTSSHKTARAAVAPVAHRSEAVSANNVSSLPIQVRYQGQPVQEYSSGNTREILPPQEPRLPSPDAAATEGVPAGGALDDRWRPEWMATRPLVLDRTRGLDGATARATMQPYLKQKYHFVVAANDRLSTALRTLAEQDHWRLEWLSDKDYNVLYPYSISGDSLEDVLQKVLAGYGLRATLYKVNKVIVIRPIEPRSVS